MDKDLKPCPFKFIREHYPMTDTNFSHSQVVHLVNEAFKICATESPAVDVEEKKRPAVEGFKDEVIDGILSELRDEFPSLDSEHASFRLACKRFYAYLASRNLIRTIPDDMVLLPRTPTKRMIQFGVDNREDGGGVTDIYTAMIHGHETNKAYEEGK